MALTLNKKTEFNIGVIVSSSIDAVRTVRRQEQSRREAIFQQAVAEGMTYEEQLKFREDQLEAETTGGFIDSDYVDELKTAVAQTKQMIRFSKIRDKYQDALNDYVTGKDSIGSYISILEDTLSTEKDETMKTELRGLLDKARADRASNELNAIKNRALVAQKDNSLKLIDKSIKEVKSKRALASVNENDDEVAMWDDTLLALEGSRAKLQIEDSINEITFKINKNNPKANDKLGYINDEIAKADSRTEIVYGGVTYPSLRGFWEAKRDEYIATSYLDEAKAEMDAETARIAATSNFGQIPTARIKAVNDYYANLKSRPEFAAYADTIEQRRVDSLNTMVTDLSESIFNEEATTGDRAKAQNAILGLESQFGIKVSREAFGSGEGSIADEALRKSSVVTPTAPGAGGSYQVAQGDTLGSIAARSGVSLLQLLDANPEYKANPNLVRVGASLNLPGSQNVPTTPTVTKPQPPKEEKPVVNQPTPTPTSTPTPTPTPTPAPSPHPTPVQKPVSTGVYAVVSGDTLGAIAARNNTTVQELAKKNNISNPDLIRVGQQIKL